MNDIALAEKIDFYLKTLCVDIGHRHVGSSNNRRATDFFYETISAFASDVECPQFDCIDWECGEVYLAVGNECYQAFVSPYSLPCDVTASVVEISTLDALEQKEFSGKILLIHGELADEPVMPKNYKFYNPEEHQRIVALLERKRPAAIIAATRKSPGLTGALYPFPMFEDGDFDIASVYMTDVEGGRLLANAGRDAHLSFESTRIPSTGCNVLARRRGETPERIVVCAHIDSKKSTPGALDDAAGTVILLALAECLNDYTGRFTVEIVALNGEDYYSAPGEIDYLNANLDRFDEIALAINIDAAGYIDAKTAFSFYECPEDIAAVVRQATGESSEFVEGSPWPQGDHSIFAMNGRPAVAITSENFTQLTTDFTHTEMDRIDLLDSRKLARIAFAIGEIITRLGW